ncbi:unnamed protein product [Amoebophrya sp. A120]|nr:unnamed protein product [Amoebophrya sp. A120]|eukprot:GSA120T00011837001.1
MSRFAFLQSDDSSDSETEQAPKIVEKPMPQAGGMAAPVTSFAEDAGDFRAVPKKKAHHMKADAKMVQEHIQQLDNSTTTPVYANGGHAAGQGISPAHLVISPVQKSTPKNAAAVAMDPSALQTQSPLDKKAMKKAKKKAANNRFACFVDSDEEKGEDSSEEEEADDVTPIASHIAPVLPKHIGLLNQSAQPDYFAIVHMESTVKPERDPVEELKKPFVSEVVSVNISFFNSKTKKTDFSFKKLVRPTVFPVLSPQTTEQTSISNEDLDKSHAQPLDEVLRELERFFKENNLVSALRNKKKPLSQIQSNLCEFVFVTYGAEPLQSSFTKECKRKQIPHANVWKKWCDLRKVYEENYKKSAPTLEDMLRQICMEFEGVPRVDDGQNVAKALAAMLTDIPDKITVNSSLQA